MKKSVLAGLITALLAGSVGGYGYKVIRDRQADVFENSIHEVVKVIDGDTIEVENKVRIRLLGIDAPESNDCYGPESTAFATLLLENKQINLRKDISGSDQYDRLLRYVFLPSASSSESDIFVQQELVRQGYAVTDARAPDNQYRDLLASAQRQAKDNQRGMWATCDMTEEVSDRREIDTDPIDPACTIKGNISEKAYGRNYFTEGCPNYNRIKIDTRKGEAYFCSAEEAEASGFTRSESCNNNL